MLRSNPATPLVCLVISLSLIFITTTWAATPDDSMEILLKPNQMSGSPVPAATKARHRSTVQATRAVEYLPPTMPLAPGITKVKPPLWPACAATAGGPICILPTPRPGQWEMSAQALFASVRGKILWPRNQWWLMGAWWGQDVNLTDQLRLPRHKTVGEFTAKYQFRPNWAVRYSILSTEMTGGAGLWDWDWSTYFWFGNMLVSPGQSFQTKWTHYYQRLGLVYDAIKNCRAKVSVFADWAHMDDRIDLNCASCGWWNQTFSKNTDTMLVGLELQRCMRTMANGGSFSTDLRGGYMFFDDVEGWDVQAGVRYSVPLNCGRYGYVKGGYRLVDIKKSQADYLFNNALEGGFVEFGLVF